MPVSAAISASQHVRKLFTLLFILPLFAKSQLLSEHIAIIKGQFTVSMQGVRDTLASLSSSFDNATVIKFENVNIKSTNSAATNTTRMQAVIDSIYATVGGSKILYGEGQYPLNGNIWVKPDITIMGNGYAGFKGSPTTSRFIITDATNSLFLMDNRTAIKGWNFEYPNNDITTATPASLTHYPTAIVLKTGGFRMGMTIEDCAFVGGSGFINFNIPNADINIRRCYGYPIHNAMIKITDCYDIPRIETIHVNPNVAYSYRTFASDGLPASTQTIDYVIANADPTFDIQNTDEFVIRDIFAFGVKTGCQIINSYGSIVQANFDMVSEMFYISINNARKAVTLTAVSGFPSAGTTRANKNAVHFTGSGGALYINAMNLQMGPNDVVPSSGTPTGNAVIKIDGSDNQRLFLNGVGAYGSYQFSYDIQNTNASAKIFPNGFDVVNADTKMTIESDESRVTPTFKSLNINDASTTFSTSGITPTYIPMVVGGVEGFVPFYAGSSSAIDSAFYDVYTGSAANLTAHTPNFGGSYTKVWSDAGDQLLDGSGFMYHSGSAGQESAYAFTGAYASANQKATFSMKYSGSLTNDIMGAVIRADITAGKTGYELRVANNTSGGTSDIQVVLWNNGSPTVLYAANTSSTVDGSIHTYSISATGSTITATYDGATVYSVTNTVLTGGSTQRKLVTYGYSVNGSSNWLVDNIIGSNL